MSSAEILVLGNVGEVGEHPRVEAIELPSDLASAHAMIRELHARPHELDARNSDLKHQLDLMPKRLYGRRSETNSRACEAHFEAVAR